jgi:predicted N-formylglutamate amidohydrolase
VDFPGASLPSLLFLRVLATIVPAMPQTSTGNSPGRSLLGPHEASPVELVNEGASAPVILVCDHASARIPGALGTLGLDEGELARHIAIDIGAAALTQRLAGAFGAAGILAAYSRLVIDCNRHPEDHTSIREISEGVIIPGNRRLSEADRQTRIREIFDPYHAAVAARVAAVEARGGVPLVVAVHSFTPRFRDVARPWHVGILSSRDRRVADRMIAGLSREPSLVIGDNEPYSGLHFAGYTMDTHATRRGLPSVMIEVRQDMVADAAGVARWADILEHALAPILADESLYRTFTA